MSRIEEVFYKVLREQAEVLLPHRRVDRSLEQREPAFVAPIENLYGVPLFDLLEGYQGQIVGLELIQEYTDARHPIPTMGYRFRLGTSILFAAPPDRDVVPIPVIVNGVATPLIDLIKTVRNVRWLEYYSYAGRKFDVAQDDILNMLDVSTGEASILVTDRAGLREVTHVSQAKRIAELNNLVNMLSAELRESKLREEEARVSARIAQGLAESYRSMLYEARNQLSSLLVEHAGMSGELQRVISDMRRKMEELAVQEAISERLRASMDTVLGTVDTVISRLQRYQRIVDEIVSRLGVVIESAEREKEKEKGGGG